MKTKPIELQASRPIKGNFITIDGEGEGEMKLTIDAGQTETIKKLLDLPYGEILNLVIKNG